jgi:hypothetical protein
LVPAPPLATRRAEEHAQRAQAALEAGRCSAAIDECDLGLAWGSPSIPLKLWLLKVRSRALVLAPRSMEELLACAHGVVALEPLDAFSWRVYGILLGSAGQHTEAARAYFNALRIDVCDDLALKQLRSLVRKFGKVIEQRMPDVRERVKSVARRLKEAQLAAALEAVNMADTP